MLAWDVTGHRVDEGVEDAASVRFSPREFLERVQRGGSVSDLLATPIAKLAAPSVHVLKDAILALQDSHPQGVDLHRIDPAILVQRSLSFHRKAGTDTPKVLETLSAIRNGSRVILLSHQPNLFPSLGVVGQFVLLDAVAHFTNRDGPALPQLFNVIDYDVAGDNRFRVAHMPHVQARHGSIALSALIPHDALSQPMWSIPKPSVTLVSSWLKSIDGHLKEDLAALAKKHLYVHDHSLLQENQTLVQDLIWDAFERADSLAEFNMIFLSKLVNVYWGLPTAFVFARSLQPHMKDAYENLLRVWPAVRTLAVVGEHYFRHEGVVLGPSAAIHSTDTLPVWITCAQRWGFESCQARIALRSIASGRDLKVKGTCSRCGFQYEFDLGTYEAPDIAPLLKFNISPRVLMDDLLDVVALGAVGGTSYVGAAEHTLLAHFVGARMGWEMPPTMLWNPRGIYDGLTERRAFLIQHDESADVRQLTRADSAVRLVQSGRASIIHYLLNLGYSALVQSWRRYLLDGGAVFEMHDMRAYSQFDASACTNKDKTGPQRSLQRLEASSQTAVSGFSGLGAI